MLKSEFEEMIGKQVTYDTFHMYENMYTLSVGRKEKNVSTTSSTRLKVKKLKSSILNKRMNGIVGISRKRNQRNVSNFIVTGLEVTIVTLKNFALK